MPDEFSEYDPATYLTSSEAIAVFMADALETGNELYISKAMEVVERAKAALRDEGTLETDALSVDMGLAE